MADISRCRGKAQKKMAKGGSVKARPKAKRMAVGGQVQMRPQMPPGPQVLPGPMPQANPMNAPVPMAGPPRAMQRFRKGGKVKGGC